MAAKPKPAFFMAPKSAKPSKAKSADKPCSKCKRPSARCSC